MAWTRFFRRRRWDEERARELEAYLQIETDENIARGMAPAEARYAARKKLGNATQLREEIYRMNTAGLLETLWQDFRYAIRQLGRTPGFTVAAVLSLALGIGANTAIFSLLDQLLLRPLPVKDPHRLVLLDWQGEFYGPAMGNEMLSYPMYRDIRDHNQVFSGVLGYHETSFGVGYQGQVERVSGELVSGNYFDVLGIGAALGRTLSAADDRIPGRHPVAMLSYDFWMDRFRGDRGVLGQTITVNGAPFSVIGVSAKGFVGLEIGSPVKVMVPMMMRKQVTPESWAKMFGLEMRRGRWVRVFGRLKDGIDVEQARASLQPLFHSIIQMELAQKDFPGSTPEIRKQFLRSWMKVTPAFRGYSDVREQYQTPLGVLMAMVGLVLLIACGNVANLLLARAAGRRREIAVRLALGAGTIRIVRQTLAESVLLALLGGATGLLGAMWIDQVLLNLLGQDGSLGLQSTPDSRVLVFTLMVCTVTGVLFGLAPALGALEVDLVPALKQEGRAVVGGAGTRLRRVLVVAQVFVSVLLLTGAGLFVRSLINLRTADTGVRTQNVIAFSIDPSLTGYAAHRRQLVLEDILDKLRAAPGVDSASLAIMRGLDEGGWCDSVTVEGYVPSGGVNLRPCHNAASPGFIGTLGIPLLAGRDFSRADAASKQKVALVNESFARHYFGNRTALGRHFGFGIYPGTKTYIEIVGVIRDAKYGSLRDSPPPQTIVDYEQMEGSIFQASIFVKTRIDPRRMYASIRRAVHDVDANLPIYGMRTLDEEVEMALTTERVVAGLASVFGLLATVLAAIGLYGLMTFHVAARTREIGIRMALGAPGGRVAWLVMREVILLLVTSVIVALPVAWGLARFVRSQLYDVRPDDPVTMLAAILTLAIVATLAGSLPARRAACVDPIQALRYE